MVEQDGLSYSELGNSEGKAVVIQDPFHVLFMLPDQDFSFIFFYSRSWL